MNIRASIQRSVWIQIEMTEEEAKKFLADTVPEATLGKSVDLLIAEMREVVHYAVHPAMSVKESPVRVPTRGV